jgi:hypothetical protein
MSDFSDSFHSTSSRLEFNEKINKISDWVDEQKKNSVESKNIARIQNVGKVLTATTDALKKFKSEDPYEITEGALGIISSVAVLCGGPYGAVAVACCSIIGPILSASKPRELSVVEQVAEVVSNELVKFNRKLHDQKFDGLKRSFSDQKVQLLNMSREEELADPDLWNEFTKFMGELSGFESTILPCDWHNLSKEPFKDFVLSLTTFCQAHTWFMMLLIIARGTFEDLGGKNTKMIKRIDKKIECQTEYAKTKLAFLSDERYLSFLGWLPSEGRNLMKIYILSKFVKAKNHVELIRNSLKLSKMPSPGKVESAVEKVSKQLVKGRLDKPYMVPLFQPIASNQHNVIFVNNTKFPMKIVSGKVGKFKGNLEFVRDLPPYSTYILCPNYFVKSPFSAGGYFITYIDGNPSPSIEPDGNVRVFEFALTNMFTNKVNIQDKSEDPFTKGKDTYEKMSLSREDVYWKHGDVHYVAYADIVPDNSTPLGRIRRDLFGNPIDPFILNNVMPLKYSKPRYSIGPNPIGRDVMNNLQMLTPLVYLPYSNWLFVIQDFDPTSVDLERKSYSW